MFDENLLFVDDAGSEYSLFFTASILSLMIAIFCIVFMDQQISSYNHQDFQTALTTSTRAYSTTYSTKASDLSILSEGYVTSEDLSVYSLASNPVKIDRTKASGYFYALMEGNTPYTKSSLDASGVYFVTITTEYNPSPKYIVSIYKNGDIMMLPDTVCLTLESVEQVIQSKLSVGLDIATEFNSSIRKAQKYSKDNGTTGTGDATYSTYSTTMSVVTNVPIRGLFKTKFIDVKEVQTYSVKRGK